jgi:hypothetical protein
MVGRRTLTPRIEVRLLVPQPMISISYVEKRFATESVTLLGYILKGRISKFVSKDSLEIFLGSLQLCKGVIVMVEKNLRANIDYVNMNKEHLLKEYTNKFILVFEERVVGSYDTYEKAAEEGVRLYGQNANFLVYHLVEKEPLNFVMQAAL